MERFEEYARRKLNEADDLKKAIISFGDNIIKGMKPFFFKKPVVEKSQDSWWWESTCEINRYEYSLGFEVTKKGEVTYIELTNQNTDNHDEFKDSLDEYRGMVKRLKEVTPSWGFRSYAKDFEGDDTFMITARNQYVNVLEFAK